MNMVPDPLGLKEFYPIGEPVQPIVVTGNLDPIVPFKQYRKLADELDRITARINALVDGLRNRGVTMGSTQDIARLAEAEDNEIITASDIEALAQMGGLEKAIAWWPIDRAMQVIAQLYEAREQTKQSIYEITGISDIIRGASNMGETATAQQIKTQWGSLRIRKLQGLIQRYVRDLFCLTSELIATKFSVEAIQQSSGMQIDEQVMMLLRDPTSHYRIDVETDSTLRSDLVFNQQQMAQFLQGTAQYFQIVAPALAQAPNAIEPAIQMYASFARQFNLGRQAEDALENLILAAQQAAQQAGEEQPDPAIEEVKRRAADDQAKAQIDMARLKLDTEKAKNESQIAQIDMALKSQDRDLNQEELKIKRAELALAQARLESENIKAAAEIALEDAQQRGVDIQ
jgi:hypothetical protein